MKCTILAGKKGNVCINCFKKLPKEEKEEIGEAAKKLQFWARNGYYIFIILFIVTVGAFSMILIDPVYFLLGLILVCINCIYGTMLFKYLSQE